MNSKLTNHEKDLLRLLLAEELKNNKNHYVNDFMKYEDYKRKRTRILSIKEKLQIDN